MNKQKVSNAIKEVKDVADDLWDTDDEELAERLYHSVSVLEEANHSRLSKAKDQFHLAGRITMQTLIKR